MSLRRSFFLIVADRKPLTECACQPVAFIISSREAPFVLSRRATSVPVLEVWRCLELFPGFREVFAGFFRAVLFPFSTDAEVFEDFFVVRGLAGNAAPARSSICTLPAGFHA